MALSDGIRPRSVESERERGEGDKTYVRTHTHTHEDLYTYVPTVHRGGSAWILTTVLVHRYLRVLLVYKRLVSIRKSIVIQLVLNNLRLN